MKTPQLDRLIHRASGSLFRAGLIGDALLAVPVIGIMLGVAVTIDAAYALPAAGLALLDVVLLCIGCSALYPLSRRVYQGKDDPRTTARLLERRLGVPGNRLINALDLAVGGGGTTSPTLRGRALAQGEAAAGALMDRSAVDRRALFAAAKPAGLVCAGLLVFYFATPSMFHAVIPRLVSPMADLPPYTRVRFTITLDPSPVFIGKPVTIYADLSGPIKLGRASVVFLDADGVKSAPVAMYPVIAGDNGLGASGADRFALRVDQVDGPRHFYISTPKGRSARMTLEPSSAPLFDKVVVSYDFPGYTGWPDAVTGLSTQGLRALEGTRVSLHIQSNTGLGGGELVVTTGDDGDLNGGETYVVTPDPTNPKIAEAVFWPDESGRFALSLIGEDGAHGAETLEGVVTVLPDRAPKVEIDYPPRQSVVPEGWPVEAQVTAGDDIGLGELLLHTSVNETPAAGIPLNKSYRGADETVADGRYTIDPARLEAKAGDTLEVFASVSDNHPRSPFTAESPVHRVHVITMRQYLDLARQRYRAEDIGLEFATVLERLEALQAQRDQLLQELAELREVVAGDAPMSEADGQRLTEITEELQDYQASASGLADHLQARAEQHTLYAFEESYKAGLRELAGQLQGQAGRADALADALQSLDSPDAHAGALRMAEAFALAQPPFDDASSDKAERTEQDLTRLRLAQAVLAAGERIRQVAFKQDELAVHMSAVQCSAGDEAPTGPRLAALAERQAELRAELEDATNTLRQASEAASALLPRLSGGALAVAHQIEQRRIVSTQSAAERAALNGQGGLAFQAASAAADQLDALLSDVGQNTTQAASDLDGFFNLPRDSLQSALSQMAAGPGLPGLGRQGGSGSGMQGSAGRVTMIGPSVPGLNGRPRAAGRGLPGGQGEPSLGEGDGQGVAVSHEIITTDAGNNDMQGSISLPGVPAEYRDQAEAYFKRLAEEQ